MDNEKIYSCSSAMWPISEMPPIQNPVTREVHFCKDPIEAERYETEENEENEEQDGDCVGRKDGSFWIVNEEYSDTQVKFCPHCGAKAAKQTCSTCE